MSYASTDDVKGLLKTITITATTKLTTTELTGHIADVDAVLDAKLCDFYTTPITSTEALKVMKTISKYKTAATVLDILVGATGQEGTEPTIKRWHKLADDLVEELKSRVTDLKDAGGKEATGLVRTGKYDAAGIEREPKFIMEQEF